MQTVSFARYSNNTNWSGYLCISSLCIFYRDVTCKNYNNAFEFVNVMHGFTKKLRSLDNACNIRALLQWGKRRYTRMKCPDLLITYQNVTQPSKIWQLTIWPSAIWERICDMTRVMTSALEAADWRVISASADGVSAGDARDVNAASDGATDRYGKLKLR